MQQRVKYGAITQIKLN